MVGCSPRTLGCGVVGGVLDCSQVGVTGEVAHLDLSALPTPVTELRLGGNNITLFRPAWLQGGSALRTLVVATNALTTLDSAFGNTPALVTLDASNNKITTLDNAFSNTPALVTLDASNNALTTVTADSFDRTPNLASVELSNNRIVAVAADTFRSNPNLTSVSLGGNPALTTAPGGRTRSCFLSFLCVIRYASTQSPT